MNREKRWQSSREVYATFAAAGLADREERWAASGREAVGRPPYPLSARGATPGRWGDHEPRADHHLGGWCRVLCQRDMATYAHSERVARWSVRLGRVLGLQGSAVRYLRWGALLHDIGKMHVPVAILNKRGPLTAEEWGVVRQHPRWGYQLLSGVPGIPDEVLEVVLYHHEHWDGGGYPQGLIGRDIPLLARIVGVVDTWDALVSVRSYHAPLPVAQARDYLLAQAGTSLDPTIAATFVRLLGRESRLAREENLRMPPALQRTGQGWGVLQWARALQRRAARWFAPAFGEGGKYAQENA